MGGVRCFIGELVHASLVLLGERSCGFYRFLAFCSLGGRFPLLGEVCNGSVQRMCFQFHGDGLFVFPPQEADSNIGKGTLTLANGTASGSASSPSTAHEVKQGCRRSPVCAPAQRGARVTGKDCSPNQDRRLVRAGSRFKSLLRSSV